MGSNYFGERGHVGLSSSSPSNSSHSSSSRKGKKNGSDKPKQPQRGLGVAQLEKIRLHNQLGCNYLPSVPIPYQEDMRVQTAYPMPSPSNDHIQGPHGVMMGFQDLDRASLRCEDSQPTNAARWHLANVGFGNQQFMQQSMTRSFFEPNVEDVLNDKKNRHDSMRSSSQDYESSNTKEIDLELRLSL